MEINIDRLKNSLERLGQIGFEESVGVTRLAYSKEYRQSVAFVEALFQEAGLTTHIDPVGNLIGRLAGTSEKTIMIGSHIDTVPGGGIFDGCLGVMGGLECVRTLVENHYPNNHSIEVVAFIEEEGNVVGGTFGSKCLVGDLIDESFASHFASAGLSFEAVRQARRDASSIGCYLELHIEQGGILDHEKIAIGVVEGIVGIHRYKIKIEGSENHAGTTPMYLRDDALVKASHIIGRLDTLVRETDRDLVGTVGVISIKPCAVNVIPGQAEFVIEMRDKNVANMDQVISRLQAEFSDYRMQMECILREGATAMDKNIQDIIRQSSQKRGYTYKNMYSGAGHDAINLAKVTPTGMIFIPSIKGISHSIREKSDWTDVKNGTEVLLETIVALDRTINDKDGTVL